MSIRVRLLSQWSTGLSSSFVLGVGLFDFSLFTILFAFLRLFRLQQGTIRAAQLAVEERSAKEAEHYAYSYQTLKGDHQKDFSAFTELHISVEEGEDHRVENSQLVEDHHHVSEAPFVGAEDHQGQDVEN
jgi:hypothetical protein